MYIHTRGNDRQGTHELAVRALQDLRHLLRNLGSGTYRHPQIKTRIYPILGYLRSFFFSYSKQGPLITCLNCDDAYHYSCHSPRIPLSKSKWYCDDCSQKQLKPSSQNSNSNWTNHSSEQQQSNSTPVAPPPPVLSPQVSPTRNIMAEHMDDETSRDVMDPNIPDASDWTSEQVYQYFARLFPKEAEIFRHQVGCEFNCHS